MSEPEPIVKAEGRNPIGWIILAALFLLNIVGSVIRADSRPEQMVKSWAQEQTQLSTALSLKSSPGGSGQANTVLKEVRDKAQKAAPDDRMAARLRVVTARAVDAKAKPEDLRFLRTSQKAALKKRLGRALTPDEIKGGEERDVADRALADGFSKEKLTKAEANRLLQKIPDEPFVYRLGKGYIRESSGQGDAVGYAVPPLAMAKRLLAGLLMMGVCLGSIVAWVIYLVTRSNAKRALAAPPVITPGFPPVEPPRELGFPMASITPTDADRLAIRAAQLFGGFVALSLLVGVIFAKFLPEFAMLATSAAMVGYVIVISRVPVLGKSLSLDALGLRKPLTLKLVGYGIFGFFLEVPVSLGLVFLGQKLFSFMPEPQHPATNALLESPSLITLISILVSAVIVAPFWEEVMFRGALFPAISRLTRSPIVGALVSSFLFAAIHPQGPVLWFSLASIAGFSCALVLNTRSLWPSVVMHFCHNFTILLLPILIS
ncbi:CPBP family intramembrane metalloprotease [bacterium]|nr:MAG: CPBP family intramembrane metalloprotease [bacterium]